MQTILLATRNTKKLYELRTILASTNPQFDMMTIDECATSLPEVEEDGDTFEHNAIKKARELAEASGYLTLADDSGLCVDALHGAPGVYSARFAGEPSNDANNNKLLLQKMQGITNRAAHFTCVIALASPTGVTATVSGICKGHIVAKEKGTSGFGYDPLFVPDGKEATFAELSSEEKQRISHRAKALKKAKERWFENGVVAFGG